MKYSEQITDWLIEQNYTHCFFVGGGNIMHLVESLSLKLKCIPVIHEVAAGIATEYFNETNDKYRALALVTAGPGLTNIVTAFGGAWLESRELLVIGGQAKTVDMSNGEIRQRGIQEINGADIVRPICKVSRSLTTILSKQEFIDLISQSWTGKKGPVFLEIPIDIQAKPIEKTAEKNSHSIESLDVITDDELQNIIDTMQKSQRPVILIGGGVDRQTTQNIYTLFEKTTIAIATTWNGVDRIDAHHPNYIGRPNTWGQRSANILIQQSDLLIAIGTRLGMQQTGFNWQQYMPQGKIIQIDIDKAELEKGHPAINQGLAIDANDFITRLLSQDLGEHNDWLEFCKIVRQTIPLVEDNANNHNQDYVSPHYFITKISQLLSPKDLLVSCSSGGAFTTIMQVFEQKIGQKVVTNKGLASMGYGLSGAIGASIANPDKRTILIEGDGGFAQNMQEIGTAKINNCNLKIFVFDDEGYASIRMTQRNYFGGRYVGCDINTGLGLPNWRQLFKAWGIDAHILDVKSFNNNKFMQEFDKFGLSVFIVKVNPEQTYFPKISSRILDNGQMESNPLHLMTPDLNEEISKKVFKYMEKE